MALEIFMKVTCESFEIDKIIFVAFRVEKKISSKLTCDY